MIYQNLKIQDCLTQWSQYHYLDTVISEIKWIFFFHTV